MEKPSNGPEKKDGKLIISAEDKFALAEAFAKAEKEPKDPVGKFKSRKEEMRVITSLGAIGKISYNRAQFEAATAQTGGDWKKVVEIPEAVALVKEDTMIQQAILKNPTKEMFTESGIIIPGGNYSRKSQSYLNEKIGGGIPLGHIGNPDGKFEGDVDTSYVDMALGNAPGTSQGVKVSVQPEEQKKPEAVPQATETKKEEPKMGTSSSILRPKTFDWKQAYSTVSYGGASYKGFEAPKAPVPIDIDLNELEAQAAQDKLMEKSKGLENVDNALEGRKKGAMERLKGLGLKAIDGYKNLKPGYKIAIGVGLAGTAFLTGGWLAGIAAASQKGLSMATMARGFYEKDIAKKTEEGKEYNKDWAAIKAIGLGILASAATSAVLENLGTIMDYAGEAGASIKKGVTTYLDMLSTPPIDDVANSPSMLEAIADSKPDWVTLPEYTVQSGDNLTNIIKANVIPHIPGAADFTDFQKENMIQNMLKYAADHKLDADFMPVNQFANPDLIHPGDVVDLDKIKEVFTQANFAKFGGDTLVNHAASLTPNQ